jgi:hypothetical protein
MRSKLKGLSDLMIEKRVGAWNQNLQDFIQWSRA